MVYTVIGIVHRTGDYNGQPYDNFNLHVVRPGDESRSEFGQVTEIIKVKASLFEEFRVDVGSEVTPTYDRYGRLLGL